MKEQSGRTFVEPVERPFRDGQGIENGFAEIRTSKRIQAGVGGAPDHVAVPFDKDVVHGAVVTAEFLQVAALRRDKISDFFIAGVRCYDIGDLTKPQEVAYFIPPCGGVKKKRSSGVVK